MLREKLAVMPPFNSWGNLNKLWNSLWSESEKRSNIELKSITSKEFFHNLMIKCDPRWGSFRLQLNLSRSFNSLSNLFFLEKNPGLTRKLFFEGEEATLALILQEGQGLDAIFVRFLFSQISHILISELNDYEIRSIMFDH